MFGIRRALFVEKGRWPEKSIVSRYAELTRPHIVMMIMVACAIGLLMAGGRHVGWALFLWTLLGVALITGGSCALNSYIDCESDRLMERTKYRPLPAKTIRPENALVFGILITVAGATVLFWKTNVLAASLGLIGVLVYIAVYTPLKRVTWANTSVGALSGAIPPLIGWTAVTHRIGAGGLILFGMLFLWQHAHFWTIAWLLRDDYRKAGFRMLPVVAANEGLTLRLSVFSAAALVPLSLLLVGLRLAGPAYACGALIVGGFMLAAGIRLRRIPSRGAARIVMLACACYLPVLLAMIILDLY